MMVINLNQKVTIIIIHYSVKLFLFVQIILENQYYMEKLIN